MSSRAVRKALREREALDHAQTLGTEAESDQGEDTKGTLAQPSKSAFALLDNDANEDDDDDENEGEECAYSVSVEPSALEGDQNNSTTDNAKAPQRKSRKKTKSKKSKNPTNKDSDKDELDLALEAMRTQDGPTNNHALQRTHSSNPSPEAYRSLSVDTSHLHAENEMRRLFGRTALHADDEGPAGRRRIRERGGIRATVGPRQGAQNGRGTGLGALALRRNIFIQGKEDWPVGTSGGLSMEVVERNEDGTVEYRFVHSAAYQDVQRQFNTCVESMDPERIMQLLQHHPYHISTLLQASEIAKQQGEHRVSGVLLERALFSFGRCTHTTFSASLSVGVARLDFRRPENREFWLAASRYIKNLSMRSTWRTVYEWARLLFAMDPVRDPYGIDLAIDQYALRARQPLPDLVQSSSPSAVEQRWKTLPNIQFSQSLALSRDGQSGKAKQVLYTAISRFPYIAARLLQECEMNPPPAVWGKEPCSDLEKLQCELYVTRAKDIWNTPEASSVLFEVSSALSSDLAPAPVVDDEIDDRIGRHVLLTDDPALIALLPRNITSRIGSVSDPLPPSDQIVSYTAAANTARRARFELPSSVQSPFDPNASMLDAYMTAYIGVQGVLGVDTDEQRRAMTVDDFRRYCEDEERAGHVDERTPEERAQFVEGMTDVHFFVDGIASHMEAGATLVGHHEENGPEERIASGEDDE